ncbi:MAG: hypothetical protein HY795_04635 [Desulfovibrio sp.]|nr:hypothetical protein [Desulfovibrio sp.]MBI4960456.1 hypothetical protein [Desulfovibrio sp.]
MYKEMKGARRCHGYQANSGSPIFLQGGIKERLFCKSCEGLLSSRYENAFAKLWFKGDLFPGVINDEVCEVDVGDYLIFKLYHLSVLFRCAISTKMNPYKISLGKHIDSFRLSILECRDIELYNLFGFILVNPVRRFEDRIIMPPEKHRFLGSVSYMTLYAGGAWFITISNHRNREVEDISLKKDGKIIMQVINYLSLPSVRDFAGMLKNN